MTNSAKTPSGKARKGQVTVRPDSGSIKACFPRNYCSEGKQIKLATGINPDNWETKASQLQRRLQIELEDGRLDDGNGNFDLGRYQEILGEYGLSARLRVVRDAVTSDGQLPPKPELSLMEVWDMYCEYRKQGLAETTYELLYKNQYSNYIRDAINAVGCEDAIKIRNWLIENRSLKIVRRIISILSKAYQFAIRQKLIDSYNPFEGLTENTMKTGKQGYTSVDKGDETDSDILDKSKAYTWNEALIILEYVKNNNKVKHWFNFLKFKFLTGCRTGEAIGLWWCDIKWDNECIIIQRSYSKGIKKTIDTKNETPRRFPMPKDGELWNLLKSIPQGEPNENVFKSKTGKIIDCVVLHTIWRGYLPRNIKGIIPTLIEQGKLTKYLPCYNTRHTFISHQIFEVGIDEKIVSAWCEHSHDVSRKHYQDITDKASRIIPDYGNPVTMSQQAQQQTELDLLKEQLRQQQELINKLLQDRDK